MKYFYYEPRTDQATSVSGIFFKVYRNTPSLQNCFIKNIKTNLPTACNILSLLNAPVLENDMTQARSTTKKISFGCTPEANQLDSFSWS